MPTVTLNLNLPNRTPAQRRIQESLTRFRIGLWGRQSGKTTNGGWTMFKRPLEGRTRGIYWHILQTHAAAEIAFNRYVDLFPKDSWKYLWAKKPNESEKTVFLTGHRAVHFKSGHKLQDLRAETLDGAAIDECRQQQEALWTQIIRPMLSRHKGWCDFYTTPNGYDWVYDLCQKAKDNPEWGVFHAPSTEAWWWTPEEIASARRDMSEPVFAQEILAEFRSLTAGKVYYAFGDHNKALECPFMANKPWSPYHTVHLGLDFNVHPMCWALGQYAYNYWWWFDEIRLENSNTEEAADELVNRIMAMRAQGFKVPVELTICGDASGKSRSTKSNQSDYDILLGKLKAAGITFSNTTPEANPSVKDRVNAMNSQMRAADGAVRFKVHSHYCKWMIHDFDRVTWKSGGDFTLDSGKDKMLTHMSDAVGYPVTQVTPIKTIKDVGKVAIISRTI